MHALYICWIHFTWYINLRCPPTLLSNAFYVWPGKQKTTARSKHILWPHELVSLVSLSFNIGHAWRPLAPPPVSFQVCAGRNFERADFTEHLQEHPVGNEQCWGLEIHQECHSPWRPSSRRLPAVRWSINNQLSIHCWNKEDKRSSISTGNSSLTALWHLYRCILLCVN